MDHGKTTLADALLATNGIISVRQAGKLRYMDNTEAEQERGITMKSSAVSLIFDPLTKSGKPNPSISPSDIYLINLIDSPGHVDFASDVSTAVRLCDESIVVVDVVEGVSPQTRTVLRQAWDERLTLTLVINKLDRLFLELRLTSMQIYDRLCRLIEQVNSVLAEFFSADVMQKRYNEYLSQATFDEGSATGTAESSTTQFYDWSSGLESVDDSHVYFSPERGNVIFASAVDVWGFRIQDFANTWSTRLQLPVDDITNKLWGDFYLVCGKDKKYQLKPGASAKGKKSAFVQLVLDQLYNIYQVIVIDGEKDKAILMAEKLQLHIDYRLLRTSETRNILRNLIGAWLPLGSTVLTTIIETCPPPNEAISDGRAAHMLFGDDSSLDVQPHLSESIPTEGDMPLSDKCVTYRSPAVTALQKCSAGAEDPVLIFVAKVFCIDAVRLHRTNVFTSEERTKILTKRDVLSGPKKTEAEKLLQRPKAAHFGTSVEPIEPPRSVLPEAEFIALARVFSGRVYVGQRLFVLGPKFDGSKVPQSMLDADPRDFPLGQVRVHDLDAIFPADLSQRFDGSTTTSPASTPGASRSVSVSLSETSLGSTSEGRLLRHVYVGEVVDVLQFVSGQYDFIRISDDTTQTSHTPAGNVVGLVGDSIISSLPKSGLLVDNLRIVAGDIGEGIGAPVLPLAGLAVWRGAPVLSVALEPASATNADDVRRLEEGLNLLERADPCAEVTVSPKGEYLLHASGEIHLQKCLEDLQKSFAPGLELHISQFVVPFRETIVEACEPTAFRLPDSLLLAQQQLDRAMRELNLCPEGITDPINQQAKPEVAEITLPLGILQLPHSKTKTRVLVRVTAHPLPALIVRWVETRAAHCVPHLIRASKNKSKRSACIADRFEEEFSALLRKVDAELSTNSPGDGEPPNYITWSSMTGRLLALGPHQVGPNLLFSRIASRWFRLNTAWGRPVSPWLESGVTATSSCELGVTEITSSVPFLSHGKDILHGFQLAVEQGPLCAEPMRGVAFVLEEIYAEERHKLPLPKLNCLNGEPACPESYIDPEPQAAEAKPDEEELKTLVALDSEKPSIAKDQPSLNEKEEKPDPVLALLKARQAAAKLREKTTRLNSVSWFGGSADEDHSDMDDWNSDDDYRESDDNEPEKPSSSESDDADSSYTAEEQPKKQIRLPDIYYWQRRTDHSWIYDLSPGLLTPAVTRACLAAFQACPGQRLVLAMYDVELQARSDVLGRMYGVLRRRYGHVVDEEMREGEESFVIRARLPVIESFDLTSELRKRTSGLVSLPQLRPGGWEVLDINPLTRDSAGDAVVSDTHRQLHEQHNSKSLVGNRRRVAPTGCNSDSDPDDDDEAMDEVSAQLLRIGGYIRELRRRKGLQLHKQLVVSADKQRTLKKNK